NTSHMDFDLDLARAEGNENPVYYVKYAHARICSVLRNAEARGVDFAEVSDEELDRLDHQAERDLLRLLPELSGQIVAVARSREISRLTSFAMDVSAAFHPFYHQCTILGEDQGQSRARLALCDATRIVLANTLRLIGVDAPERM
ncbi:arginine--tRNA ligase, partial [bacterium]